MDDKSPESFFSGFVVMTTPEGVPRAELHMLTGRGDWSDDAHVMAAATQNLAEVKIDGITVARISRDTLDDETIAAFWSTLIGHTKALVESAKRIDDAMNRVLSHVDQ